MWQQLKIGLSRVSDTHGKVAERLAHIPDDPTMPPAETALIILGDAGFNFYLNTNDDITKAKASIYGYTIYCVRGNHEERPEFLPNITSVYDENVKGEVWMEADWPLIRYLKDGYKYTFGDKTALILGGAYSVDKYYRLARAKAYLSAWSGWFAGEQLSKWERDEILASKRGQKFDFVFSHTCPKSWMPTDLFLSCVDQSTVDNSTEEWLDEVKNRIDWGVWCFGHFHADRLERPRVEQYYQSIDSLKNIWNKWHKCDEYVRGFYSKSPNYYMAGENNEQTV